MSLSKNPVPVSVESWVEEQKYEYIWKIGSFPKTTSDPVLKDQKLVVEAGKDTLLHSKWIFSLYYGGGSTPSLELESRLDTIVDRQTTGTEIMSRITVTVQDVNGSSKTYDEDRQYQKVGKARTTDFSFVSSLGVPGWYAVYLDSNGALTLLITLSLYKSHTGSNVQMLEAQFLAKTVPAAYKNLADLLDSESVGFDAKIVCSDGKEFNCHKEMLKVSSPVFKAMLESKFSEAHTGVIKVTDVSGKAMEILVQLFYTGQLMKDWKDPEVIFELTYAAGKYEIKPLLDFLDGVLGTVNTAYYDEPSTLLVLKNLTGKLGLKKAEAELKDRIIKLTLSSKRPADMEAVFGEK